MALIKDTYQQSTSVIVSVVASPLVELIVANWATHANDDAVRETEHRDRILELHGATRLSPADEQWMAESNAVRWTWLLQHVISSDSQTTKDLITTIKSLSPEALTETLSHLNKTCDDEACEHSHVDVSDPKEARERFISILSSLPDSLDETLVAYRAPLEHDRDLTKFLARRLGAEQLIETVTNGIAYRLDGSVTDVVLLPSALIRPFNLMFELGSARYFVYPLADEAIDADADLPPGWMIELFKALGDEKRLRLLRKLGESSADLTELSEYLGLGKSTTHHHLRSLRAAGLVRTVVAGGKDSTRYEARTRALSDATKFVGEYLRMELGAPSPSLDGTGERRKATLRDAIQLEVRKAIDDGRVIHVGGRKRGGERT